MGFLDDTIELIEIAATSGITSAAYTTAKQTYLNTYEDLDDLKTLISADAFRNDPYDPDFNYPDTSKLRLIKTY